MYSKQKVLLENTISKCYDMGLFFPCQFLDNALVLLPQPSCIRSGGGEISIWAAVNASIGMQYPAADINQGAKSDSELRKEAEP